MRVQLSTCLATLYIYNKQHSVMCASERRCRAAMISNGRDERAGVTMGQQTMGSGDTLRESIGTRREKF